MKYGRRVSRRLSFKRSHVLDLLIVIGAAGAALDVVLGRDGPGATQSPVWFAATMSALLVLVLLARHRFPFAAPATVWGLAAVISFVDGRLVGLPVPYLAGLASAAMLGNLSDTVKARVGLAVVIVGAALVVHNGPNPGASEMVYVPLTFAVAWIAGFLLRVRSTQTEVAEQRAARAERERTVAARLAVAEERTRIARELHDVVAHAVSVMVLQTGAVRHRLPDSLDADREALSGVERTGRDALAEMRRVLGALRHGDEDAELAPQPGLDGLDALVAQVEQAGVPVQLEVVGDPALLPRGLELSAYRIVQEALTNTLKHAAASRADVVVRYGDEDLRIEVRDDGSGATAASRNGSGHGLVGVRERVAIYGGEMSAGPAPEGGYVLSVRLPLGGEWP